MSKRPKTIKIFGKEIPVDEDGIINWKQVEIPEINIPEGSHINDVIKDVTPREKNTKNVSHNVTPSNKHHHINFCKPFSGTTSTRLIFDGDTSSWLPWPDQRIIPGQLVLDGLIEQFVDLTLVAVSKYFERKNGIPELKWSARSKERFRILSPYDFLADLQVYFVTEDMEGTIHEIYNIFSKKNEMETIPKLKDCAEKNSPEYLGMYLPSTGTIYIVVDHIKKTGYQQIILQKVFLHEFIHFLFDVIKKSVKGLDINEEEMYDNFLVLHYYENASYDSVSDYKTITRFIRNFITNQPMEYSKAIDLFDKNREWLSARKILQELLTNKIPD